MSDFKTMKVVLVHDKAIDPAIDTEKSDLSEYAKTRDEKHLVFLPDTRPNYFFVKKVPAAYILSLKDNSFGTNLTKTLLFTVACHRIELGDGSVMEAELKTQKIQGGNSIELPTTDKWVTEVCEEFGLEAVLEIGQVALDFGSLGKKNKRCFSYFPGSPANL